MVCLCLQTDTSVRSTGRIENMDVRNPEGYMDTTQYLALSQGHTRKWYKVVYICSPYAGDVEANIEKARRYCRYAVDSGCMPIAPHLLYPQFMDDTNPGEREAALRFGIVLLSRCTELWWFGDVVSQGMRNEIEFANRRGIPVIHIAEDRILPRLTTG